MVAAVAAGVVALGVAFAFTGVLRSPDNDTSRAAARQSGSASPTDDTTTVPPTTTSPTTTTTGPTPSSAAARPSVVPATPAKSDSTEPPVLRDAVSCPASGLPAMGALPRVDGADGKKWVTVGELVGRCDATSAVFHVRGIDTRLVFRSDADHLAVFVVDRVQGLDATAGFADADCAGPCSDHQLMTLPAGDYSIRVQAGDAPWQVAVQEYRTP